MYVSVHISENANKLDRVNMQFEVENKNWHSVINNMVHRLIQTSSILVAGYQIFCY